MSQPLLKREAALLGGLLVLVLIAVMGPAIALPAHYHDFADQRSLLRIPHAMDVLSNLPFALWAIVCARLLDRTPHDRIAGTQRTAIALFASGLAATALSSSWYHWQPSDAGLAVDRVGMVVAFAGLLGAAVADRISARAGALTMLVIGVLGPLSLWAALTSGNMLAWSVLQVGGLLVILALACLQPIEGTLGIGLMSVVAIYVVAKLLELSDQAIYDFTGHALSGHSVKHIVASCAAWPVAQALQRAAPHNTHDADQPPEFGETGFHRNT